MPISNEYVQQTLLLEEENYEPRVDNSATDNGIAFTAVNRGSEPVSGITNANRLQTERPSLRPSTDSSIGNTGDNESLEARTRDPVVSNLTNTESATASRSAMAADHRNITEHQEQLKIAELTGILENGNNLRPEVVVDRVARCMDWWTQYDVTKTNTWQGYPMYVAVCFLGLFAIEGSLENTAKVKH